MKNKLFIFLVLLVVSVISIHVVYGVAVNAPHLFYGSVTLNGADAPVGTVIRTTVGGESGGSLTVTTAGQYGGASASEHKLAVSYSGSNGATITFSADFVACTTTSTFEAGALDNLDLTCGTTPVSPGEPAGGGGTGGGGAPGGAAVAPPAPTETLTEVTNPKVISDIQQSLPEGWDNIKVEQVDSTISKTTTASVATVDNALSFATAPDSISALQALKNAIQSGELTGVSVTKTSTVYKITNKDTGLVEYRTQIHLVFTAPYDMEDINIIETIPKAMASTIDDIVFIGEKPTNILQSDPVVQWLYSGMSKGQTKDLSYVVKKKVTEIKSITTAAGKRVEAVAPPPPEEKPRIVTTQVVIGISIMILVVLVGLVIYYAVTRKKKEERF